MYISIRDILYRAHHSIHHPSFHPSFPGLPFLFAFKNPFKKTPGGPYFPVPHSSPPIGAIRFILPQGGPASTPDMQRFAALQEPTFLWETAGFRRRSPPAEWVWNARRFDLPVDFTIFLQGFVSRLRLERSFPVDLGWILQQILVIVPCFLLRFCSRWCWRETIYHYLHLFAGFRSWYWRLFTTIYKGFYRSLKFGETTSLQLGRKKEIRWRMGTLWPCWNTHSVQPLNCKPTHDLA